MKISVLVPVYNVEQYLKKCIESILAQSFQDFEIILVDDGSKDSSSAICDEYAGKDGRITVIHKDNGGLSDARNTGIKIAGGDFIFFLDSDDFIDPDTLESLWGAVAPSVDIVIGGYKKIYGSYMETAQCDGIEPGRIYTPEEYFASARIDVVVWGNLYRRSYLIEKDIQFRVGFIHEDNEIFSRLFLQAGGITGVRGTFYNYVVREGSLSTSKMTPEREKCLMTAFEDWLEKFSTVKSETARKALLNYLITTYLNMCHDYRLKGWRVKGLDLKFVLDHTERPIIKLKALWFTVWPSTYFMVRVTRKPEQIPL